MSYLWYPQKWSTVIHLDPRWLELGSGWRSIVAIGIRAFHCASSLPEAGATWLGEEDYWRRSIFLEAMVRRGGPRSVSCSCPRSAFNSLADFTHSRMLQKRVLPEVELAIFCERYIPSARAAYKYALDLSKHESSLDGTISNLEARDIIHAMNDWTIEKSDGPICRRPRRFLSSDLGSVVAKLFSKLPRSSWPSNCLRRLGSR